MSSNIQEIGEWLHEPVAEKEERVISVEITAQMTKDEIVDLILVKCQQYYHPYHHKGKKYILVSC